jgi:hypothetical protein
MWVFGNSEGIPHVMLNVVKHPRGTGFFVSLRMTRTPANPKEPFISIPQVDNHAVI